MLLHKFYRAFCQSTLRKSVIVVVVFISLAIISCSRNDDNRYILEKKNAKILIVGNSILKTTAEPEIGWNADWGMAASSREKDFLNIFTDLAIKSQKYNLVTVDSQSVANWESDFTNDLNQYGGVSSDYDVLIIRLGENVNDTDAYYNSLKVMINHFKSQKTKVIITDVVWPNEIKTNIQRQIALDNNYEFIPLVEFQNDSANYSWGLYENNEIGSHPSDKGMQQLANLLYQKMIQIY